MAHRINIPPHANLESWESNTALAKGRNLTHMVDGYAQGARQHTPCPPSPDTPRPVRLVMLEIGQYYHGRVTPRPEDKQWDLEAVNSIIPVAAPLPDAPTTVNPGQPPDPMTAVTSGQAGSWHPARPLLPLATGPETVAGHQVLDRGVQIRPQRPPAGRGYRAPGA